MLDLIIKNARNIQGEMFEIGVQAGKIATVAKEIREPALQELHLSENEYISAGWIDDHVHCYEKMQLYYDYPDEIGVTQGVTTVIDAGTTGAENIGDFAALAKRSKTNVLALLNISKWGIVEQDELADLSKVQGALIDEALENYPDFIVGIKARMSKTVIGDNGLTPLQMAKKIQKEHAPLPLMVHIGSAPPELDEIFALLDQGDVVTHCFNGKANGIYDWQTGKIKDFAWETFKRGIIFDIGHGTDSFNFTVAKEAFQEGLKATSISTDIYIRNRKKGPVFNLATTMEKLRVVGYSWPEILEKVTVAPAKNFNLNSKGAITEGLDADFTIFKFVEAEKELIDSNGNQEITNEQIVPVKTVIGGQVYDNELSKV
ncbi:amidohydrolase/deacetylase family metallohydrolase [Enterococcus sp. LJL120]